MPPPPKATSWINPLQTMRGHTKGVACVVHLRDRRRIITSSYDGSLRLWNLESGVQIGNDWREDEGSDRGDREEEIWIIALSPKGKTIASGGHDGKVTLWDVETEKVVPRWTGHTNAATMSLCWSVDGERVVSGSYDGNHGMIRVWDVENGDTVLGPINTGHLLVNAVIYSPDATTIATGGQDENALKIWDAKAGSLLSTIEFDEPVDSLAWTSDQKKIIIGSYTLIRIFDTATWQEIAILEDHTHVVRSLSLFQNDRLLVSASHDKTVRLWNLDTNLPVGPPIQHQAILHSASISADGKQLVTACADKNAYVWDIHTALKDAGLEDLLSTHDVPQDVLKQKSSMDTNATRRLTKPEYTSRLPPRFFDDAQDGVQTSGAHSPSSASHPPRSSVSPPHVLFNRFSSLFHRYHNTNQSMELQQIRPRPGKVAAVRDKQALYVAPRRQRVSDMARRIKNPTRWTRCILFICCVSITPDADDAQDTNHPQDPNNAQDTGDHQ